MFNVCPQCGMYKADKKITDKDSKNCTAKAECPDCGYKYSFSYMPLYLLIGTSGSGKTAVSRELVKMTDNYTILEGDILWCEQFNNPEKNYKEFKEIWLRLCKNISLTGKPVVLNIAGTPEEFENCIERRYFSQINYFVLVCEEHELKKRLNDRPEWRNSNQNLEGHLNYNRWLKDNIPKSELPAKSFDTTGKTPQETAKAVKKWLNK